MMPLSNVEGFTEEQLADPVFRLTCGRITIAILTAFCIMATPLALAGAQRRLTSIHVTTMKEAPTPVLTLSEKDKAIFWAKVNKDGPLPDQTNPHYAGLGPCWVWTAGKCSGGYGGIGIGGKHYGTHRIGYFLANGIMPSQFVCHRCDNRSCVNPARFFLGTSQDNHTDMIKKGRSLTGDKNPSRLHPENRPKGDNHYAAKVSSGDVIDIREKSKNGVKRSKLAREYNVNWSTIDRIIRGSRWKCTA